MSQLRGIKSYKQVSVDDQYDAIVIGSGMSGLTCAAVLARDGQKVLVLEKHYTAGGFTHVFKRKGYEWDVGIHYIGAVNDPETTMSTIFHYISGGKMEWEDMGDVYDRIWFGDEEFPFRKGQENFSAELKSRFPDRADHRAIDLYLDLIKQAGKASTLFFAEKALPVPLAKVAGGRMRKDYLRFASQTTRDVLEELTDNQKLIGVLTAQFGDYGLPPAQSSFAMHAMVVNHYMNGAAFPVGGSARIAETIAETIADADGLVLTNAGVDEIVLDRNGKKAIGVRLEDGKELYAPLIISSAGVMNTYQRMLPTAVQDRFNLPKKLENVKPSVAHLGLYIGFKETAAELGLQKANYWVYPDGEYNHDKNIAAYVENPENDFPLVYISFPASKDPEWEARYPGRATVDIITLAPYEWFAEWDGTKWKRRGDEYEAFKESLSQRLLEILYRYEPQLRGKVDYYELSTPLSTKDFVNYQQGEIYGLSHSPDRFEQTFLRPHTPIKNLYLTGQDIVTAGVGGALMSGMVTISAIKKWDYVSKVHRAALAEIRAAR